MSNLTRTAYMYGKMGITSYYRAYLNDRGRDDDYILLSVSLRQNDHPDGEYDIVITPSVYRDGSISAGERTFYSLFYHIMGTAEFDDRYLRDKRADIDTRFDA